MSRTPKQMTLRNDGDTPAMRQAIDELEQYDGLRRTSAYQLKIADVNFYPDKQTVQIDNLRAQKAKGIDEFLRILNVKSALKARSHFVRL